MLCQFLWPPFFFFEKSFVSFGMDLFGIILIGVNWAFWIWRVLFFFVHRCFQPLFLYIYFSWPQFFSSSLDSDGLSIRHECYCPLGPLGSFSLFCLHWIIYTGLSSSSLTFYSVISNLLLSLSSTFLNFGFCKLLFFSISSIFFPEIFIFSIHFRVLMMIIGAFV